MLVSLSLFFCVAELSNEQRDAIKKSKRISNPGCYPTGFIGLTKPLVDAGIIPVDTPVTVNAISGYSGGGKQLMAIHEAGEAEPWGAYAFDLVSTRSQKSRFFVCVRVCVWSILLFYYFFNATTSLYSFCYIHI